MYTLSYYYILLIFIEVQSTGVKKAVTYAGLVYYEEDGVEDLVTFTSAKKLEALIHVRIFFYTQLVIIIIW